jgi:Fuc2NAc and GlcNAc transferase
MFALLVMWPFIGDGLITFIRRASNRETLWKPHRSHLYQRLVRTGLTHAQVSAFYAGWSTASVVAGLMWLGGGQAGQIVAALFPLSSLCAVFVFVKSQERRVLVCQA